MLAVRLSVASHLVPAVVTLLADDETVCDVVHLPGVALGGQGDVIMFQMTRENGNAVMGGLRDLGVQEDGSIVVTDPLVVISDSAAEAEALAPGHPVDGVLWAQMASTARADSQPSISFFVFLLLATLIAGIGRLLDQPILIIGAMVVGPEFAPLAAIAYAIVRRRRGIISMGLATLLGGFAVCAAIAWGLWAILYAAGLFTYEQATTGEQTAFIITPDGWSFVIAALAGVAGILSMTTAKSSALVGVFISITTVPAVGTIGLTLAVGAWGEAWSSAIQLLLNLAGLLIASVATLYVQRVVTRSRGRLATRIERRRIEAPRRL